MKSYNTALEFDRKNYSNDKLIELYKALLLPRLIEEKMILLLRQNRISKWFSAWGQEAISVGATLALESDEFILPMHRNLGVFTARNLPLTRLFSQFQGKANGFTKGRDRSFHFGTKEYHIVGMISHLGPQLGIADGIALANKLSKEKKATLVFSGDGGTSQGDFHEAANIASVWQLPVIFAIESNGWGLSTPSSEQFNVDSFASRAAAYSMEFHEVDGNNILAVYDLMKNLAESIRVNPRPVMVELKTFRMRGHEESSGTKYIPKHFFEEWEKKDPILNYENYLLNEKVISESQRDAIRKEIVNHIADSVEIAFSEPMIDVNTDNELNDIYAPNDVNEILPNTEATTKKRFIEAISDGLSSSLDKHQNLIIMGQDIAEYGGVFKVTEHFVEKYSKDRIRNTPLCESGIIGTGLGLSIAGYKAVVEMQFADFVSCGFNQIVNNLAKLNWRWGENADVVVRLPTGAGVGAGPFHSQSTEAWFFHVPGLKIVYPAFPNDAKGLLISAINDKNPVLYFEHKQLYRSLQGEVYDDYFAIEIGKGNLLKEGKDLTIITYGAGVHWALQTLEAMPQVSADLIDLRTLLPWDREMVFNSIKKTNKAIILHEDTMTGGIGAEISAVINRECFEYLDAPVVRCAALDTPIPFADALEKNFLPKERFAQDLLWLWKY